MFYLFFLQNVMNCLTEQLELVFFFLVSGFACHVIVLLLQKNSAYKYECHIYPRAEVKSSDNFN